MSEIVDELRAKTKATKYFRETLQVTVAEREQARVQEEATRWFNNVIDTWKNEARECAAMGYESVRFPHSSKLTWVTKKQVELHFENEGFVISWPSYTHNNPGYMQSTDYWLEISWAEKK